MVLRNHSIYFHILNKQKSILKFSMKLIKQQITSTYIETPTKSGFIIEPLNKIHNHKS